MWFQYFCCVFIAHSLLLFVICDDVRSQDVVVADIYAEIQRSHAKIVADLSKLSGVIHKENCKGEPKGKINFSTENGRWRIDVFRDSKIREAVVTGGEAVMSMLVSAPGRPSTLRRYIGSGGEIAASQVKIDVSSPLFAHVRIGEEPFVNVLQLANTTARRSGNQILVANVNDAYEIEYVLEANFGFAISRIVQTQKGGGFSTEAVTDVELSRQNDGIVFPSKVRIEAVQKNVSTGETLISDCRVYKISDISRKVDSSVFTQASISSLAPLVLEQELRNGVIVDPTYDDGGVTVPADATGPPQSPEVGSGGTRRILLLLTTLILAVLVLVFYLRQRQSS